MLQNNMIPMLFMQTKDGKQKAKYSKPLGTDALQGWKLCHIEPIGFNSSKSINEIEEEWQDYYEQIKAQAVENEEFKVVD